MNVDFVKDDYRFNARASAIILNEKKDKILLLSALLSVITGQRIIPVGGGNVKRIVLPV